MKLLCDACQRLLPPASWSVADGALRLVCSGCGATAVQAAPPPVQAPITERVTPPVPVTDTAGSSAGEPTRESWLDAEWAALLDRWEEPEAHRRLLARAEVEDELAGLGRRYKERLDAAPGDAAALRARDELLKRAAARLLAVPSPPAGGANAKNVIVATVLLTAVGLLVVLLVQLMRTTGVP